MYIKKSKFIIYKYNWKPDDSKGVYIIEKVPFSRFAQGLSFHGLTIFPGKSIDPFEPGPAIILKLDYPDPRISPEGLSMFIQRKNTSKTKEENVIGLDILNCRDIYDPLTLRVNSQFAYYDFLGVSYISVEYKKEGTTHPDKLVFYFIDPLKNGREMHEGE
jgi:hypothetical protein